MPFSVRTVKSDLLSTLPVSTINILKNGKKTALNDITRSRSIRLKRYKNINFSSVGMVIYIIASRAC